MCFIFFIYMDRGDNERLKKNKAPYFPASRVSDFTFPLIYLIHADVIAVTPKEQARHEDM